MEITVTDKAFNQLLDSGANGKSFLRLGVQQGGCAGLSYAAFIDENLTEADSVIFEQEELIKQIEQECTRNERAALAFTLIQRLRTKTK